MLHEAGREAPGEAETEAKAKESAKHKHKDTTGVRYRNRPYATFVLTMASFFAQPSFCVYAAQDASTQTCSLHFKLLRTQSTQSLHSFMTPRRLTRALCKATLSSVRYKSRTPFGHVAHKNRGPNFVYISWHDVAELHASRLRSGTLSPVPRRESESETEGLQFPPKSQCVVQFGRELQ